MQQFIQLRSLAIRFALASPIVLLLAHVTENHSAPCSTAAAVGVETGQGAPRPAAPVARRPARTLADQFQAADMVLECVVRRIAYRMSDREQPGELALPLTYVTLDVIEVFRGAPPRPDPGQLTLRLVGGPMPDGRILLPPDIPYFEVGQRQVLLLQRDPLGAAHLPGGEWSRLRLCGEAVFSAGGRELRLEADDVTVGPRHDLAEAMRVQVGSTTFHRVRGPRRDEPAQVAGSGVRLQAPGLRELLRVLAKHSPHTDVKTVEDARIEFPVHLGRSLAPVSRELGERR